MIRILRNHWKSQDYLATTFFFLETRSHRIAQASPNLTILTSSPYTCWDFRHALPCQTSRHLFSSGEKENKEMELKRQDIHKASLTFNDTERYLVMYRILGDDN